MKTYLNRIWVSAVFIFYFSVLQAQQIKIDSLQKLIKSKPEDTSKVNALVSLGAIYARMFDSAKAIQLIDEAISISRKINYKDGEGRAFVLIANIYLSKDKYAPCMDNVIKGIKLFRASGNLTEVGQTCIMAGRICLQQYKYSDARNYCTEALEAMKKAGNKNGIANAYVGIGDVDRLEENFPNALKNHYAGLKLLEETGNKHGYASTSESIGYDYYDMVNYTEALKFHTAAWRIFEEIHAEARVAFSRKNIGDVYIKLGNFIAALENCMAALNFFKKEKLQSWEASTYTTLGNLYEAEGTAILQKDKLVAKEKFKLALDYYLQGLRINEMTDFNIDESFLRLGNIYTRLHEFAEAKQSLEKSILKAKETNYKQGMKEAYWYLSVMDSIQGNYKDAYLNYKLFALYRDSLINEESIRKTTQVKMQYDFDKKESAAKAMQLKKDEDSKRTRNFQYFVIGLFVVVVAFLYLNNRQKQKAKKNIENAYKQLQSTQAQLIQSEKMASLGELTAGIAHEIQNPLNFVNNFSEVNTELIDDMQQELKSGNNEEAINISNDIKENQEKIGHHGKRADAIVKGMLQHSRKTGSIKEPTDINALCDEYLRLAYHGLRAKDKSFNATFKTDFDETIGNINIIPQDIGRVLLNLITNAFYAVAEKKKDPTGLENLSGLSAYEPTIWLSTKKAGDKICISVRDNGRGIPQKILNKIFQPFFTTKPTGQGTGLGLSLAYDIVKAHGGELKVETKEAEGTTFIIWLPVIATSFLQ